MAESTSLREANKELQLELRRLRDENELLRATVAGDDAAAKESQPQPFRFLDLPKDIRLIIYDICLVRGNVTIRSSFKLVEMDPYDSRHPEKGSSRMWVARKYHDNAPPSLMLQVFQVNKQLHDEALPIFLSKNHFIISILEQDQPDFFDGPFRDGSFSYGGLAKQHLRSVSISFDWRMTHRSMAEAINDRRSLQPHTDLPDDEDEESYWMELIHERTRNTLLDAWSWLKEKVACLKLRYLEVDLTECYCSFTCHRLIWETVIGFSSWEQGLPDVMEFIGTTSAEEREGIKEYFQSGDYGEKIPEIRFRNYRKYRMDPNGFMVRVEERYWYNPEEEDDVLNDESKTLNGQSP